MRKGRKLFKEPVINSVIGVWRLEYTGSAQSNL